MSERRLRELVVTVMGGMDAVRRIADLPDVPKKMQPDTLRELARYLVDEEDQDDDH